MMNIKSKIEELQKQIDELTAGITTNIILVLDRSGSMATNKEAHESGIKELIEQQKKTAGTVTFSFVQFDDHNPFDLIYDKVSLDSVKEIKLDPRGFTPLYDAVGRTINHFNDIKGDVIFVVVTDGLENRSREFSRQTVNQLIVNKKKADWQFIFLGTNFDVTAEASTLGLDAGKVVHYTNTDPSIMRGYQYTGQKMSGFRASRACGQSAGVSSVSLDFCDDEINEIKEAK